MFWYRWTKVFGSMLTFLRRVLSSLPLVWANTDIYHWQRLRTCKPFRSDVYLFIKWLFTYEKLAKYLCTCDEKLSVKLHKLDSTVCRRRMCHRVRIVPRTERESFCFCLYPSFTVYLPPIDYQSAIKLLRIRIRKIRRKHWKDVASSFRVSEGGSIYRSFCIRKSRRIHPFR